MSRTKSSAAGGGDSISSLSSSGERNLFFRLGGDSVATVEPLRVISISSPSATRLSTAEKFRATSVAVSLVTP